MNKLNVTLLAIILVLFLFNSRAFACEPIVPLAILFGIPLYSLFGVVILKAILFAWLEKSISIYRSVLFVLIANIFSSFIGFLLVLAATGPTLIFVAIPIVYFISITPSKRFVDFNPWRVFTGCNSKSFPIIIVGLYFLTFVLFGLAQSIVHSSLTFYWLLKYSYILIALTISIGLTTLWEEWVISKLSRSRVNFFINVLKVNLVSFFIIMACLAAMALPKRLLSKDFLI